MNSNKIISLFNFYQYLGIDYLIDNIDIDTLQSVYNPQQQIPENTTNIFHKEEIIKKDIKVTSNNPSFENIKTISELKQELLKFEGCSLKKTAINTVFGTGKDNAEIMVIGEAPGAEEDEQGEPFVGRSGKLLMSALASVGLEREKIFITNTIFWRPPGNRNPTIEEMQLCYPFLSRMIEIINPKMIIIVGKVATSHLIKIDIPISKMRGKWYDLKINQNNFLATILFHPSYLLRNPIQKKSMWLDLLEIKDKIQSMEIKL